MDDLVESAEASSVARAHSEYLVAGQRIRPSDPDFNDVLARAYADRASGDRPLCLCRDPGVEMYIARVGGRHLLKRMPGKGPDHAWSCPTYDPPPELSGLGQVLGTAINEDTLEGSTSLRLGFPLSKVGRRAPILAENAGPDDAASTSGTKLTLRALLHFLWEEAGFNRWTPAMAGKRNWAVVRRYLVSASERKHSKGAAISELLLAPEVWDESRKDVLAARHRNALLKIAAPAKGARKLMLLLGEVKQIAPARYGHKLVLRHAPDLSFGLDEDLFKALQRRFELELSFWEASQNQRDKTGGHLIAFGTFSVSLTGYPLVEELVLMYVDRNWIPVEDVFEQELVERLVSGGYKFTRGLRYNLPKSKPLACAVTADHGGTPTALYVIRPGADETFVRLVDELIARSDLNHWVWRAGEGEMPPLPARHRQGRRPSPPPEPTDHSRSAFDPFEGLVPATEV